MISLQQIAFDLSNLPDWAMPAIGGGCMVVILFVVYLLVSKKKDSDEADPWHGQPVVRSYERQIMRQNEAPLRSISARRCAHGNPIDIQITDIEAQGPAAPGMVLDRCCAGCAWPWNRPTR